MQQTKDMPAPGKGTALRYRLSNDILVKMLFTKNPDLLKSLVSALTGIPYGSIKNFVITNPEIPPDELGKKSCRLDMQMDVNEKKVTLEIQVEGEGNYGNRSLYYWARTFSSTLLTGRDYSELPQTIVISILFFDLFGCDEVHSEYRVMEVNRHTQLTDKLCLHFFELKKLNGLDDVNPISERDLWLAFFKAKTEEEIDKLAESGGDVMSQAVEAYRTATADAKFKALQLSRDMAAHDAVQALNNARRKEREVWEKELEVWKGVVAEVVAEKDSEIAARDSEIAERDTALAEQAAQIAELLAKLGSKSESSLSG